MAAPAATFLHGADCKAGYRYDISILQAEFSTTQVLDRPLLGRLFFNADGFYDVQQPGIQPRWNNRGIFVTGLDGHYSFIGIKPYLIQSPTMAPLAKCSDISDGILIVRRTCTIS